MHTLHIEVYTHTRMHTHAHTHTHTHTHAHTHTKNLSGSLAVHVLNLGNIVVRVMTAVMITISLCYVIRILYYVHVYTGEMLIS